MNADICMQTHRRTLATGTRWQARTKTHTLWETSNSRAYISLKIHAANAGARACCFLDISLPKGLYFILPSNPMWPQFSHNHIFPPLFALFPFSETFEDITEDLTTALLSGETPGPSVRLLLSHPSLYIMFSGACSVQTWQFFTNNSSGLSLLRYSRSHTLTLLWTYF